MKNQTRLQISGSVRSFAEDAALYRVLNNPQSPVSTYYSISSRLFTNLERMTNELLGRLVQTYPGEFLEHMEKELSRYPTEYRTR
jgi:hypothetical protein